MEVVYTPYEDIDKTKWDACVDASLNSLIYVHSIYLDHMSDNWDALILGDYEAVMPLTWRKKLQIRYLYQPAFIQQGGIYSSNALPPEIINQFIREAMIIFKFAEITLNYANVPETDSTFQISSRNNYILSLTRPYNSIYKDFDYDFRRRLRRVNKLKLNYCKSSDHKKVIELYRQLYASRHVYFFEHDYLNFEKLCGLLSTRQKLIIREIISENKELLATVLLIKENQRLYNIMSCITPEGRKAEANYFMYDRIIDEFSGSELTLDMEGSDVKGIQHFYMKLHPQSQPYPFIRYNNLHPLIKIFKP